MSSLFGIGGGGNVGAAGGSFYSYSIDQSLRFNEDDAPRLTRSIGTPTNETVWTFSCWLKRSTLNSVENADHPVVSGGTDAGNYEVVGFWNSTDDVIINSTSTGSRNTNTTQVFRDLSSWYNLVVQRNGANQIIYINGEAVNTISSASSSDSYINKSGHTMTVGCHVPTLNTVCFDGYLADVVFVDGTAVPISSLGETINGIWVAKDPSSLTFGNNGYYLKFADSSALGTDSAGNGSFSTNGVAASDVVPDSPTNNFPVLIPGYYQTTQEGRLKLKRSASGNIHTGCFSTMGVSSGKWYVEIKYEDSGIDTVTFGVAETKGGFDATVDGTAYVETSGISSATHMEFATWSVEAKLSSSYAGTLGSAGSYGSSPSSGDIIQIALDMDNKKIWYGVNGTYIASGDPANGNNASQSGSAFNPTGDVVFVASAYMGRDFSISFNFGQDSANVSSANTDENGIGTFEYAPPSGFLALCTANLPEPVIGPNSTEQADDYFNTVLYTGDGTSSNAITVGFQPDWTWIKQRDGTPSHALFDSVRGADNVLRTNGTEEENNSGISTATFGGLTSFDSNGFTVDDGTDGTFDATNGSGDSYVAWNWKAGTSVSGTTSGSGTGKSYTGSVNTTAGFSIIAYSGNGTAGHTIPHHLGAVPKAVITKKRSATGSWGTYHVGLTSASYYILLNDTAAQASNNVYFNGTAPTDSVVTRGTGADGNANDVTYIQYAFAEIEGYSKVGSYVGNGSSDGVFVYTGHRVRWLMVKASGLTENWYIYDAVRNTYNVVDLELNPNASQAEQTFTTLDFVSNGFKLRTNNSAFNASGQTYIYLAIGDSFKYANAR